MSPCSFLTAWSRVLCAIQRGLTSPKAAVSKIGTRRIMQSFGWAVALHIGVFAALIISLLAYVISTRHILGYHINLSGFSLRAARFAGVKPHVMIALCLGLSGALAGIAGVFELDWPGMETIHDVSIGLWLYRDYRGVFGAIASAWHRASGGCCWQLPMSAVILYRRNLDCQKPLSKCFRECCCFSCWQPMF